MSDDAQRAARPTLKLKSGVARSAAVEVPAPAAQKVLPRSGAALRGKGAHGSHGPFGPHAAHGADEYMQRMQADMDALSSNTKLSEPTR